MFFLMSSPHPANSSEAPGIIAGCLAALKAYAHSLFFSGRCVGGRDTNMI